MEGKACTGCFHKTNDTLRMRARHLNCLVESSSTRAGSQLVCLFVRESHSEPFDSAQGRLRQAE